MKKRDFTQQISEDLRSGIKHTKLSIEKIAATFGISDKTLIKELTELAIVLTARQLAHENLPLKTRFDNIVKLYYNQVNLSHRTSQSMLLQQYSTPAPIGFIAGVFCGFERNGEYFEPSAGNGLLTIAGSPQHFVVNEIDNVRNENLRMQHYHRTTMFDAAKEFNLTNKFDGIITNPPFGSLDKAIKFDEFPISVLDHLMCIYALNTMKDSGRAALIVGGHTAWDEKGRIQAGKNRIFFSYLHKHYNVMDAINIDGHKLYSRQGTAFNVRLILINGRKKQPGGFPPLYNPDHDKPTYTFEELYDRIVRFVDQPQIKTSVPAIDKILEAEALALELELELLNLK
jgi:predicted RNA methylase